ncbi:hypothetical protein B4098_1881 [Heyndrickxia coagulans]|uniref:Uncharacterized protein n=1 Tax=Heyndrickxia coagulans TaxID=1398 RepID=A0A150K489_HEYCO|nr:hypothetical protein B4098_1881 [Heyndrickxia coagulans]
MIQPLKRLLQKRNPSFRVFSRFGGSEIPAAPYAVEMPETFSAATRIKK